MNDRPNLMRRDASWWSHPGTSYVYHVPRDEPGIYGCTVATCSERIVLADDVTYTIDDVGVMMCQRCKRILDRASDSDNQGEPG